MMKVVEDRGRRAEAAAPGVLGVAADNIGRLYKDNAWQVVERPTGRRWAVDETEADVFTFELIAEGDEEAGS